MTIASYATASNRVNTTRPCTEAGQNRVILSGPAQEFVVPVTMHAGRTISAVGGGSGVRLNPFEAAS